MLKYCKKTENYDTYDADFAVNKSKKILVSKNVQNLG